jgi:hypothetical protein
LLPQRLFRWIDLIQHPVRRDFRGTRIIWLPKRFGHFSIDILEDKALEAFVEAAFACEMRRSSYMDQLSEEMIESSPDSAASFNRSALLMYLDLLDGANLALAFFA